MQQELNNDNTLDAISSRLLAGWKMLSMACPITGCAAPLLQEPNNGRIYCCNCKMFCKEVETEPNAKTSAFMEHPDLEEEDEDDDALELPDDFSNCRMPTDTVEEHPTTTATKQQTVAKEHEQHNKATKQMGVMMLNGWTMLADVCPHCPYPIMRSKANKHWCCYCESDVKPPAAEEEKQEDKAPANVNAKISFMNSLGDDASSFGNLTSDEDSSSLLESPPLRPLSRPAATETNTVSDTDKVSSELGKYMLQGYTLLGEVCASCDVPLLRRNNRTFCCLCLNEQGDAGQQARQALKEPEPAPNTHVEETARTKSVTRTAVAHAPTLKAPCCVDPVSQSVRVIEAKIKDAEEALTALNIRCKPKRTALVARTLVNLHTARADLIAMMQQ